MCVEMGEIITTTGPRKQVAMAFMTESVCSSRRDTSKLSRDSTPIVSHVLLSKPVKNIAVKGTAPEDFSPQNVGSSAERIMKKKPAYRSTVRKVGVPQRPPSPSKTLHALEDA